MSNVDEFMWPPKSVLCFTNGRGKELFRSTDRRLDLSDYLMLWWPHASRTIYMNLKSKSTKWESWSESNLKSIEDLIRYDLDFDGYRVSITRVSSIGGKCVEYFRWKLMISTQ
jgi:hypothetical protein